MQEPVFYYDFSSPYAYISAHRVEEVLGVRPRWQPILFGALLMAIGREPWSWHKGPARDAQMEECVERAAAIGLPLSWPRDWPMGTYSLLAPRAALVAEEFGRVREFSLAAYRQGLGLGRDLTDLEVVLEAADEAGLDREALAGRVQDQEIKDRLREVTEEAVAAGVKGVPTIKVGEEIFWGDDRLERAAELLAQAEGESQGLRPEAAAGC
jgi:2-hydroxychromene-2-carboxylate isomerase